MKVKIRDYPCFKGLDTGVSPEIKEALDLTFPDAYKHADTMAAMARLIKERNKSQFSSLPFCHTVEGEAMGGRVNYGDEKIGPRGADPVVDSLEEVLELKDFDLSKGRIKEVLDAISLLKSEGEDVILEVSGPITALNIVVDPKHIFIAMRKDPETLKKVYDKMHKNLLAYIEEAVNRGVDVISYADSAGAVNIIGSKMLKAHVEAFLVDFLEDVKKVVEGRAIVHLCPKSARALLDTGHAKPIQIPVHKDLNYDQAIKESIGKEVFIADRCINNKLSKMPKGSISALRLID